MLSDFCISDLQVAFDPLDGSSIVGANFAVGSIFGVWPGGHLVGRKGSDQVAAMYAVYGPRTILVVAWQQNGMLPEYACVIRIRQRP